MLFLKFDNCHRIFKEMPVAVGVFKTLYFLHDLKKNQVEILNQIQTPQFDIKCLNPKQSW